MFFTATNDNQHTDLQPVYVHDSGVEQPDLPDLGEQEEQNHEEMHVDGPDDDNDDDDYDIYPSSLTGKFYKKTWVFFKLQNGF